MNFIATNCYLVFRVRIARKVANAFMPIELSMETFIARLEHQRLLNHFWVDLLVNCNRLEFIRKKLIGHVLLFQLRGIYVLKLDFICLNLTCTLQLSGFELGVYLVARNSERILGCTKKSELVLGRRNFFI